MQMQGGHDRPAFAYSTLVMFILMFVGNVCWIVDFF